MSNVKITFIVRPDITDSNNNQLLRRRVAAATNETGYIAADGQVVSSSNCETGTTYTLNDAGMLGKKDNSSFYSTNPGVAFAPFATSSQLGTITTNWTINGTSLYWMNETFLNGQAVICKQDRDLIAYFTESPPSNCTPVVLSLLPGTLESCFM